MELQGLLCHLGPRLAGLSVLLHTTLLPALPWVSPDIRNQIEVSRVCTWSALPCP